MKLVEFPEQTVVIAKDQPEYLPMPAHIADNPEKTTTICWKLTWWERLVLLFTGRLWHQMWTFGGRMTPQVMMVEKPVLDAEARTWNMDTGGKVWYFGELNSALGVMRSVNAAVVMEGWCRWKWIIQRGNHTSEGTSSTRWLAMRMAREWLYRLEKEQDTV